LLSEKSSFVGFEVLTAVSMESTVFWDVTPCSAVEVHHVSEQYTSSIFRVEE
jgi:hypothetical protein